MVLSTIYFLLEEPSCASCVVQFTYSTSLFKELASFCIDRKVSLLYSSRFDSTLPFLPQVPIERRLTIFSFLGKLISKSESESSVNFPLFSPPQSRDIQFPLVSNPQSASWMPFVKYLASSRTFRRFTINWSPTQLPTRTKCVSHIDTRASCSDLTPPALSPSLWV